MFRNDAENKLVYMGLQGWTIVNYYLKSMKNKATSLLLKESILIKIKIKKYDISLCLYWLPVKLKSFFLDNQAGL